MNIINIIFIRIILFLIRVTIVKIQNRCLFKSIIVMMYSYFIISNNNRDDMIHINMTSTPIDYYITREK